MHEIGDIVSRCNFRFPDNGQLDLSISGHPTLNISDEVSGEIYFLRISSNISSYSKHSDKMEIVKNTKTNGLSKPSVIKVDHILKDEFKNQMPRGYLSDQDYDRVMKKFHEYQKSNNCLSEHCYCCDYKIFMI